MTTVSHAFFSAAAPRSSRASCSGVGPFLLLVASRARSSLDLRSLGGPAPVGAEAGVKGPVAASSRIWRCAPSGATLALAPPADAAKYAAAIGRGDAMFQPIDYPASPPCGEGGLVRCAGPARWGYRWCVVT